MVFGQQASEVCEIYNNALELHRQGVRIVSNDEKTGILALQREHVTIPAEPGRKPQRVEHNYIRHGTLCLIADFEVATGLILAPTIGQTRTEKDYVNHIRETVNIDPEARWVFVSD